MLEKENAMIGGKPRAYGVVVSKSWNYFMKEVFILYIRYTETKYIINKLKLNMYIILNTLKQIIEVDTEFVK